MAIGSRFSAPIYMPQPDVEISSPAMDNYNVKGGKFPKQIEARKPVFTLAAQ